jgi:hypothetical protein
LRPNHFADIFQKKMRPTPWNIASPKCLNFSQSSRTAERRVVRFRGMDDEMES